MDRIPQLRRGQTPMGIVNEIRNPDFHTEGYPKESIDRSPATGPYSPVLPDNGERAMYEVFCWSPRFAGIDEATKGGGAVAVGSERKARASGQPDQWRIRIYSATALQKVWFTPGPDANGPAELAVNNAIGISGEYVIPGRTNELSFYSDASNSDVVWVIIVAEKKVGKP